MMPARPPRLFIPEDILAGRVSLDGYPFRYVYISVPLTISLVGGRAHAARVDGVFTAVEFLETRGWQPAYYEQAGQIAYLRNTVR